jgi:hypothetical protein
MVEGGRQSTVALTAGCGDGLRVGWVVRKSRVGVNR